MAKKFKLEQEPSFVETVKFRRPGGKPGEIEVTYKFMPFDEYKEFLEDCKAKKLSDEETATLIATGWNVDADFTVDGVREFFNKHAGAKSPFFTTWHAALQGVELKN